MRFYKCQRQDCWQANQARPSHKPTIKSAFLEWPLGNGHLAFLYIVVIVWSFVWSFVSSFNHLHDPLSFDNSFPLFDILTDMLYVHCLSSFNHLFVQLFVNSLKIVWSIAVFLIFWQFLWSIVCHLLIICMIHCLLSFNNLYYPLFVIFW